LITLNCSSFIKLLKTLKMIIIAIINDDDDNYY